MQKTNGWPLIECLLLASIVVICLGWVSWGMNVYKLIKCDFAPPYRSEIIRGIGIVVPPVGAITGLMKLEDGPDL